MTWHQIHGYDAVADQFRRALVRGRLASSFLFVGPEGIGKWTFALELAQSLLCQRQAEEALNACGECVGCVQVAARTHPDLELIAKPKDKSFLPLELLIGDKEHRMRRGLCRSLALKPLMGGRKIAIIDDADFLNAEGANSLLKTLEEPPPRSLLILIATSPAKQLPTIRSRCQLIRFQPLPTETVSELLIAKELVDSEEEARRLAAHSEGSLRRALELAEPELWTFRSRLFERLTTPVLHSVPLAGQLLAFVDEAGKEPAARRRRLRQIVKFATEFYRDLLHGFSGIASSADNELRQSVQVALERWGGDQSAAAACLDRCLEAAEQIDRNANQTTLLECWLDDLAKIIDTGQIPRRQ